MSGSPPPGADLRLSCQPSKTGTALLFPYTLENRGGIDVYAMHALPGRNPEGGEMRANEQGVVVILDDNGDAILGKFAPPLPTDRRMAMPVLPLARHLSAGAKLEGRIEIPLPLAETSPYFPDLALRRYEVVDIKGVVFTIGYWLAGVDGLVAAPAEYAPEFSVVATRDTRRSARRVSQRFPTTGLQIFKRTDRFPRTLG
jgi:hypothetical protein